MKRNTEKDKGKGGKENFNLFLSPYLPYAFVSVSFIVSTRDGLFHLHFTVSALSGLPSLASTKQKPEAKRPVLHFFSYVRLH